MLCLYQTKPKCDIFKMSLQYDDVKLWKNLPDQIQNAPNIEKFKKIQYVRMFRIL